jgi:hypothetical protein
MLAAGEAAVVAALDAVAVVIAAVGDFAAAGDAAVLAPIVGVGVALLLPPHAARRPANAGALTPTASARCRNVRRVIAWLISSFPSFSLPALLTHHACRTLQHGARFYLTVQLLPYALKRQRLQTVARTMDSLNHLRCGRIDPLERSANTPDVDIDIARVNDLATAPDAIKQGGS